MSEFDKAADMLSDYANALRNGDLDGAGHSLPADIEEVVERLVEQQACAAQSAESDTQGALSGVGAAQGGGEAVAYMHEDPKRVDVLHADVWRLLRNANDAAGHLHRPVDKSGRYTIPLYTHPVASVPIRDLCYLYWSAYHAGHHDTVEGQYTDVFSVDRFDYWEDDVHDCLAGGDMPGAATPHPASDETKVLACTHPDCGRFYCHNAKRHTCRARSDDACAVDHPNPPSDLEQSE